MMKLISRIDLLLVTYRQVSSFGQGFANHLSNYQKMKLSKTIQPGVYLGILLVLTIKAGLTLIKIVLKPLAKTVLKLLGLTAAAAAAANA